MQRQKSLHKVVIWTQIFFRSIFR